MLWFFRQKTRRIISINSRSSRASISGYDLNWQLRIALRADNMIFLFGGQTYKMCIIIAPQRGLAHALQFEKKILMSCVCSCCFMVWCLCGAIVFNIFAVVTTLCNIWWLGLKSFFCCFIRRIYVEYVFGVSREHFWAYPIEFYFCHFYAGGIEHRSTMLSSKCTFDASQTKTMLPNT